MAWATSLYSSGQINRAGRAFISLPQNHPARDEAMEVINNWRSCHSYPLHIVCKTLATRVRKNVEGETLTARRIKRLSSISTKLQHNPNMRLSQMQDIGGCRAVLPRVQDAEHLAKVYELAMVKHPNLTDRPYIYRKDDYIVNPKPDGYRGIHLIMKYESLDKAEYSGQIIEVQIRTALQHAWATSVETCQAFTGQALKSKVKAASANWLRFFSLMGSAIAERERRPGVRGTPETREARKKELSEIESTENIITMLQGWSVAMHRQETGETEVTNASVFLLKLDTTLRRLTMIPYKETETIRANQKYLEEEKATENSPNIQVVLVSADSLVSLRRAYPNYFVDTENFISAIQQEIY